MAFSSIDEPPKPAKLESQSEDNLKQIAKDWVLGRIFTHLQLGNDSNSFHIVFMPFALGAAEQYQLDDIGLVYEYIEKAGPSGINGFPIFFSCRVLNKVDTLFVIEHAKKISNALEAVQ